MGHLLRNMHPSITIYLSHLFHAPLLTSLLRAQKLCESRGGRPGLPSLISLTVSVDVKQHSTMLRHWSQFVPNTSTDIRGHEEFRSCAKVEVAVLSSRP